MSREWTDSELIQFCNEGPFESVSDDLLAALRERYAAAPDVQRAVEASPRAEWLRHSLVIRPPAPPPAVRKSRTFAGLSIACVCIVLGILIGKWAFNGPPKDVVVQPQSHEESQTREENPPATVVAKKTPDDAKAAEQPVAAAPSKTQKAQEQTPGSPQSAQPVTPAPAPPVVAANEPWSESLDLHKPPQSFSETAWTSPGVRVPDVFPPSDFRRWFSAIPGRPFNVGEERVDSRSFSVLDGQARLRAPWVDSAVLRMTVYDVDRWGIYLWRGNTGVRLAFFRHRQPMVWAVHRVIRPDANASPVLGELLTTDCGRWQRTSLGTLELRAERGHVVLARGDLPLLMVPFDGRPDEVVFDGKLKFRECAMFRGDPLPTAATDRFRDQPGPSRFPTAKPADLAWKSKPLDGSDFRTTPASTGSGQSGTSAVELSSTAAVKEMAWSWFDLPQPGLSELIFRVDYADPGTGVYFGAANGQPHERLAMVWDSAGGRLAMTLQAPGDLTAERQFDGNAWPPPYVGGGQWFRLIVGIGVMSAWVSPDGIHWGWIGEAPLASSASRLASAGVFALPGADRRIRLSHLEIRDLPTIVSIAAAEIRNKVNLDHFEPLDVRDFGSWLQQVVRTRPVNISLESWRRACAVECLRGVPNAPLGQALLSGLLSDALFPERPAGDPEPARDSTEALPAQVDRKFRLLREAALLYYLFDHTHGIHFSQLWQATTEQVVAQRDSLGDNSETITSASIAAMTLAPLWSSAVLPLVPHDALRRELVQLVESEHFDDALALVDQVTFWNTPGHPSQFWWSQVDSIYNHLLWAELASQRILMADEQTLRLTMPRRWKATPAPLRHLLAQPLSKEAYNVMAEFQAAISGKAFADACQVIGAAGNGHLLGLLPDSRDDKLLVAFPNAVALAMDEHPELRTTMNDKFGAVGRLRVRQAMDNGDADELTAATVQFYGTQAAAESERWLGDRAFAAGKFAQARTHYEHALKAFARHAQVATTETTDLTARLGLVAAMLGVSDQRELASEISLADQTLNKEQFAALAGDLKKAAEATSSATFDAQRSVLPRTMLSVPNVPAFASYKLEPRSKFEGDVGEHAGHGAPIEIDWFSRQFSLAVEGPLGYFSNRFQLTCLDLTNGQPRWNQPLGSEHGHAHHWPMVPMRPIVWSNWVFCRRLTKQGPELVCHDKNSGNVLWTMRPKSVLVSDPLVVQGRLSVFAAETISAGPVEMKLLTVHAETGSLLNEYPVMRLFDDPQLNGHTCQAVARDGLLYFAASGVVGCCDVQGQLLWLRRQAWMPPAIDAWRFQRAFDSPLLHDDLLVVTQPGVPVIEALDVQSGRVRWSRAAPDLRRLLGLSEGRLIVETQAGLEALTPTSGEVEWRYAAADLLDATVLPALLPALSNAPAAAASPATPPPPQQRRILLTRVIDGPGNNNVPCLVWIDANTGREVGYQAFEALADKEPRIGPFLVTDQKTWCLFGRGRADPRRDILELIPATEKLATQTVDQTLWAGWLPEFQRATFIANAAFRPNIARRAIPSTLRDAFAKYMSGWLVIPPPNQPKESGLRAEVRGQKDALAVLLSPRALNDQQKQLLASAPVDAFRLVRQVRVPKVDDAVLRFRVGHEQSQKWQLIIEGGNCRVFSSIIDDQTAPSGWQDLQISLAHLADSTVELTITCAPVGPPAQTWVYLANLDGVNQLLPP